MNRDFSWLNFNGADVDAGADRSSDDAFDFYRRGEFYVDGHVGLAKTGFSGTGAWRRPEGALQNPKKILGS